MKRLTGDTTFRSFNVQAASPAQMADVQDQITELLRQRHKIGPGKEDDFLVRTQQEISDTATETSRVMTMLLGSIAGRLAARRRHRHHEHHARQRDRADPRDRHPHVHRRARSRHPACSS